MYTKERHPKWVEYNVKHIDQLYEKNIRDGMFGETLCEIRCTQCQKEMGEHEFSGFHFICPNT